MARYTGGFKQMTTGNSFTVDISVNGDSSSTPQEIVLGATPFTMSLVGDEIYKPARYSKATLQVRTSDYLMNLYAAGAQSVKAELKQGGTVVWTGYVTPNIYNMGFAYERNTIELELVDALSTLRYYPYKRGSGTVSSFLDILARCIAQAHAYNAFYWPVNTQKASTGTEQLLSKLYISEENFFDKKEDATETDDDVAWTYKDVLEEICKYMGVTAVAVGQEVYFLDYDALRAGDFNYYKYALSGSTITGTTSVTRGITRTIAKADFSGVNSDISLDEIYNKVRVKDSLYDYDDVIPGPFDTDMLNNITANDQDGQYQWITWYITNMGTTQAGKQLKVLANHLPYDTRYKNYHKYFSNPHYTLHQYAVSGSQLVESTQDWANYTRSVEVIGAYLVGVSVNKVSEYEQQISNVQFTNYLCIRWNSFDGTSGQGRSDITADDKYPMIESSDTGAATAFFGGDNAYIIIQGKVRCLAVPEGYPPSETRVDDKAHNNFGTRMWLPASLQIGNYYWNGSAWTTTASKFKLYFSESDVLDTGDPGDTDGGLDADKFYNKDFDFRNTVAYEDGLDEEGYAIPLSGLPLTLARPKFTIYNPHHMVQDNSLDSVWISGLKLIAAIGNPDNDDKESDTEYVNVIENGSVKEKSAIEMKICTWDNKKPNFSAPCYYDYGSYEYLDKTFNRACQAGEDYWNGSDPDGLDGSNGLRQEEHMIYRLVNQYSTPSVILKLPLRADLTPINRYNYGVPILTGKLFVMTALTIDYKMNTSAVTLEEKK